jgi:hypothetical protein
MAVSGVSSPRNGSSDEPRARDRLGLCIGDGDPHAVRQVQAFLEGRSRSGSVGLCPFMWSLRIFAAGQRGHQERAEVRVQAPDNLVDVQSRGPAVAGSDGR